VISSVGFHAWQRRAMKRKTLDWGFKRASVPRLYCIYNPFFNTTQSKKFYEKKFSDILLCNFVHSTLV
jgi:hypothetical protein